MATRQVDVPALVEGVLGGDRRAVARAITLVESHRDDHRKKAQELLVELLPHTGTARRVGISGVPGVGNCRGGVSGESGPAAASSWGSPSSSTTPTAAHTTAFILVTMLPIACPFAFVLTRGMVQ